MTKYILGIHDGIHDASAVIYDDYRLLAAVPLERLTRIKAEGDFSDQAIDEVLHIVGIERKDIDVIVMGYSGRWRPKDSPHLEKEKRPFLINSMVRRRTRNPRDIFDFDSFFQQRGFSLDCKIFFYEHHKAHALGALFHTDWDNGLIYTADGQGDTIFFSAHILKGMDLTTLWGTEKELWDEKRWHGPYGRVSSMGLFYEYTTYALGFPKEYHAGKVLGLAGYGKPLIAPLLRRYYSVDKDGKIKGHFANIEVARRFLEKANKFLPRKHVAASTQRVLEEKVLSSVSKFLKRSGVRHLALAGGVFANVRLNQRLIEELPLDEIFIYPAMSDQGLSAGGVLSYLLERDGLKVWLKHRHRLSDVYWGRDYDSEVEEEMERSGASRVSLDGENLADKVAALLDEGKVMALYKGRMEFGPRALGARSILARPVERSLNDSLNKRLGRTEFMPFAPVVPLERAQDIFHIAPSMLYAARFMTITCKVRKEWRKRIPAVVHVDGTARPQLIERASNPLYYDILIAYEKRTGLPVLINTSFNAHEEPIIDTPAQCAQALADGRIDMVITRDGLWGFPHGS